MNIRPNTRLPLLLGLSLSLSLGAAAATDSGTTREERLERVQQAVNAANQRTRSEEAREYIAERGYETREMVAERNLGESAPPPSRAYDGSAQRPSALDMSE